MTAKTPSDDPAVAPAADPVAATAAERKRRIKEELGARGDGGQSHKKLKVARKVAKPKGMTRP